MKTLLFFSILICCLIVTAQDTLLSILPSENFSKAEQEYSNGNYKGALKILELIHENDSLYPASNALKIKSLYRLKDYTGVIRVCDLSFSDASEHNFTYYLYKGTAYMELGKFDNGIDVLKKMTDLYPKSHLAAYNMAVCYENLGDYKSSLNLYKASIHLNPYFADAHYKLGDICLNENKITQALLCYDTYLLLNPTHENALNTLVKMERILSSKNQGDPRGITISEDDSCFKEIDQIIKNYIALNKSYIIDSEFDLPLVKQNHAMMTKLEKFTGNKGFFDRIYVPFYRKLFATNKFNNFTYRILSSTTNEKYKSIIEKNYKNPSDFVNWIAENWTEQVGKSTIVNNDTVYYTYWNTGETKSVATPDATTPGLINYTYYYKQGNLSARGSLLNGNRDGNWKWWFESGLPSEEAIYNNGEPVGKYQTYHRNGMPKTLTYLQNNKYYGEYLEYNQNGQLIYRSNYEEDKLHGMSYEYYPYGELFKKYEIPYKNGVIDGQVIQYYTSGEIMMTIPFKNGQRNGEEKHYQRNGDLTEYFSYENDQLTGKSESYYPDGTVKVSRMFKNGFNSGIWKSYFSDGSLETITNYNDIGNFSGESTEFQRNGKIYKEFIYDNGVLNSYKFFNKNGEMIVNGERNGDGSLHLQGVNPNGSRMADGNFNAKGERIGIWNYYNHNGYLNSTEEYRDNLLIGKDTEYYLNGQIKSESSYLDGKLHGIFTEYYINGTVSRAGQYINGLAEGAWYNYYSTGIISEESYYLHDNLSGINKNYTPDQKLAEVHIFLDGFVTKSILYDSSGNSIDTFDYFKDTIQTKYYPNGNLKERHHLVNGFAHGISEVYYISGELKAQGSFFCGDFNGEWNWYNEKSQLFMNGAFEHGKRTGKWITFHDNETVSNESYYKDGINHDEYLSYSETGQVIFRANYIDGEQDGKVFWYNEDGILQMVRIYDHGRIVAYTYHGSNGELVPEIPIECETGDITCYYSNGNISVKYSLLSGQPNGTYSIYFPDGKIQEIENYLCGVLMGKSITYYSNGKIKSAANYLNDQLEGEYVEYFPNGNIKKVLQYNGGISVKSGKFYNENGSIIRIVDYFNGEEFNEIKH